MKKSTNKTSKQLKLALHRETITLLTPLQLSNAAGGDSEPWSALHGCWPISEPIDNTV